MSAPKQSLPTKKGRYYVDPADSGQRYISVTNVIDTAVAKPALIAWAARTVAEEAVNDLLTLVRLCRTDKPGAVAWLKGKPFEKRDTAAKRGTSVHDLAERHALDLDLGEIDEELAPYVTQYLAFRDDFTPEYEATEITVANRTLGYAGTLDALLRIPAHLAPVFDGRLTLVDYKTGKGVYSEVALQLAAYANAEVLWLPDGTEVPMPTVRDAAVLHLRADGYSLLPVRADEDAFAAFTAALHVARYLHEDSDGRVGEPLIPIQPAVDVDDAPAPILQAV